MAATSAADFHAKAQAAGLKLPASFWTELLAKWGPVFVQAVLDILSSLLAKGPPKAGTGAMACCEGCCCCNCGKAIVACCAGDCAATGDALLMSFAQWAR